jgi:hypothetical protein
MKKIYRRNTEATEEMKDSGGMNFLLGAGSHE